MLKHRIATAALALLASATVAGAQSISIYDPNQGGSSLLLDAPANPWNQTITSPYVYSPSISYTTPRVPSYDSYAPSPPSGPTAYPCTLPIGCR